MKFNSLMPEFYVVDFKKSLNFYTNILGFKLEYQRENPLFAFLSYYDAQLMIQELVLGEKEEMKLDYPFGRGLNFEIRTPDVSVIIESLKKHNYLLTRGIKESWRDVGIKGKKFGSREILINDPDGFLLRFAQDLGGTDIKS